MGTFHRRAVLLGPFLRSGLWISHASQLRELHRHRMLFGPGSWGIARCPGHRRNFLHRYVDANRFSFGDVWRIGWLFSPAKAGSFGRGAWRLWDRVADCADDHGRGGFRAADSADL